MKMSVGHTVDWDDIEVCYLCEKNHDASEGSEVEVLDGEWVCERCQKEELTSDQ